MKNKLSTITLILLLLFSSLTFLAPVPTVKANPDWLSGWSYRKSHVINNATGAGTNYQVQIIVVNGSGTDSGNTVYINNKTRSDFGDVRFTKSDGVSLLDYWMETLNVGVSATFWVEVADDLSSPTKEEFQETYTIGDAVYGDIWKMQTFTPQRDFFLYGVTLLLQRIGSPSGDFIVSIRATDADGKPTGSDLVSKSVAASSIPVSVSQVNFVFDNQIKLTKNTQYAIVVRLPNGEPSNDVAVFSNTEEDTYPYGTKGTSPDGGATWTLNAWGLDWWFQTWSIVGIYIYYGNPTATTTSNGANTFWQFDDFDADRGITWVPDGRGTWQTESGGISGNQYTGAVVSPTPASLSRNSLTIQNLEITLYAHHISHWDTDSGYRILFRMTDSNNHYDFGLVRYYGKWYLGKVVNGGLTWLTSSTFGYSDGWHKITIKCVGTSIQILVDNTQIISFTDSSITTSGYIALAAVRGKDGFDILRARKLVDPEPSHGAWGSEETSAIERSASQTLTIIPVPSRQTSYDRAAFQSFQILVAASRQLSLPRLASQLVNFVASATRQTFLSRTASMQLLMLTQTSRQSSYTRTAIQSLNILMQSAREVSYQRPINIPFNILSEATRLTTVTRTSSQILTILSEATRQRILHRFVNQPLEMLLSATRKTSYYRGVDQFFSILTETTRQSTLYRLVNQPLEMLLSATRLTTATRTSSQILTMLTETTRQSTLYRLVNVPFNILSEATRLRTVTRTPNQILTILSEATRQSTLYRLVNQPLEMLVSAARQMSYHRTAEVMLQFNTQTSIKFIIYVEVPTPTPAPTPVPVMPSIQLDAIIQTAHITSLWWKKTSTIEVLVINKGTIASDVTFQYQIIDQQNNIIAEGTQTVFISGLDKKTVYIEVPTPPDGTYTVHFKTTSPVKVEAKTVSLIVETPFYGKLTFTILIILLAALAIYLAGKRRR